MVTREEGKELAANGATGDEQEWDAAWDDGEAKEDDGADAWGWGDDEDQTGANEQAPSAQASNEVGDDAVDAWGWGEETGVESTEDTAEPETQKAAARKPKREEPDTREITVKETYSISSMPEPVLSLISGILEDGAALTREGYAADTGPGPKVYWHQDAD